MPQKIQITRTSTPGQAPADNALLPGQLAVEMADPAKLWVGVPTAIDATGKKLLVDTSAAGGMTEPIGAGTWARLETGAWQRSVATAGDTLTGPLIGKNVASTSFSFNAQDTGIWYYLYPRQGAAAWVFSATLPGTLTLRTTGLEGNTGDPITWTDQMRIELDTGIFAFTTRPTVGGVPLGAATVSDTPPTTPSNGELWWDSDKGNLYVWYIDEDSAQWVEASSDALTTLTRSITDVLNAHYNVAQDKIEKLRLDFELRAAQLDQKVAALTAALKEVHDGA